MVRLLNNGIFLLLGSNQGNPAENISRARDFLQERAGQIVRQSSLYRTAAWGKEDQPDFNNQVIEISTPLDAEALLDMVLKIEQKMGRIRLERWGTRIIDIDILFYGQSVIHQPGLHVPHPAIAQRKFTLAPLTEIAPHLVHPVLNKTMAVLLQECPDNLTVERLE